MNNIDKNIFNSYETVETALLHAPVADETSEEETTKTENIDVDGLIRELRVNGLISNEDKIIVNEDETGIDVDVYRNGQWYNNVVLYVYD